MINKRLMNLLKDSKKYVAQMVIWNWIALLCNVVFIFSFAYLLENLLNDSINTNMVIIAVVIDLLVVIIRSFCYKKSSNASFYAAADVKKTLRENIYNKLLRLGSSYEDKIPTAEIVQVSGEGVEQLEIYFGKYLAQLFYSLAAPVTLFIILAFVNIKASAVLLVCVPLIPISIVAVQKFAKKLLAKYWGIYTGLGDSFLENLQGLTTLKIYEADARRTVEMDKDAEQFRKITMRVLIMQLNSISVMDLVAYGGAGLGIIVALLEFSKGNLTIGGLFAIIMLSSEFFIPLRLLGSFFHIAMNGMAASKKIFKILDLDEGEEKTEVIDENNLAISFKNVGFAYDEERSILNGVDYDVINPSKDQTIVKKYSARSVKNGKLENKLALQRQVGLPEDPKVALIGIVTRLTEQKGLDLIINQFEAMCQRRVQIIILGSGDHMYEDALKGAAWAHQDKVSFQCKYDFVLSNRIYAGCDMFLMPSLFEPCGLSQMMSLKYGTIPIVRETGGLADSVQPYNEFEQTGTGFSFSNYNAHEMMDTIDYALHTFYDYPDAWDAIVQRAMAEKLDWDASAEQYIRLFASLL